VVLISNASDSANTPSVPIAKHQARLKWVNVWFSFNSSAKASDPFRVTTVKRKIEVSQRAIEPQGFGQRGDPVIFPRTYKTADLQRLQGGYNSFHGGK